MNGHEYTVEFRILSSTLDPAKITQELGLEPCQIRIEGTLRADGKPQRGMWAYDGAAGHTRWENLSDGLTFVLDKLWPHRETIGTYKTRGELIWWCGHFQSAFDGGPSLSPALLRRLGEFDVELYLDNYFSKAED